mgnify:CR=1 FL=1
MATERPTNRLFDKEGKEYGLNTLITAEKIQKVVKDLGRKISEDYKGQKLLLVGVLKGAHMFLSDLEREIDIPGLQIDFIDVSSYQNGTESSGMPQITRDVGTNVAGWHVLFVEDIVDTGYSLDTLLNIFKARGANSVETAALLSKPDRRQVEVPIKYIGIEIPNVFVVGYGLDYQQTHRELPYIAGVSFVS